MNFILYIEKEYFFLIEYIYKLNIYICNMIISCYGNIMNINEVILFLESKCFFIEFDVV